MISFSDEAMRNLADVFRDAPEGTRGLRIAARRSCSGFSYAMTLESDLGETDLVIEIGAVPIILDPWSQLLLAATRIGFQNDAAGAGFIFENPDQPSATACGGCSMIGKC